MYTPDAFIISVKEKNVPKIRLRKPREEGSDKTSEVFWF